jgi:uncharacterized protein (DUF1501 family)
MEPRLAERVLAAGARAQSENILVVVQLAGGNDGLNMLVPYTDGLYYQKRPTLAIPPHQVLPIDQRLGLHPGLNGLKALYDRGQLAIVQGVGYPNPSFSHFRSTDIWQSALPVGTVDTGWLGRYLDSALADVHNPLKALSIGPILPKAFFARNTLVPAVESLASFRYVAGGTAPTEAERRSDAYQRISSVMANITDSSQSPYLTLVQLADTEAYRATVELASVGRTPPSAITYPNTALAGQLKLVSQIIATNLGTRVFLVTQTGFDDHAIEESAFVYPRLMAELDGAMAAFHADMVAQGRARQVLLLTFSEFGRRPQENGSQGTDHGTAAPMLVIGGGVKGGLYGQTPSLSDLDYGNLKPSVDFRAVYSTVIANWMGADPRPAVLGTFPTLPFV